MKSFNWGIIGPGNIAHDFANDIKLISPRQTLKAVLSHREESANDFADTFNVPQRFTKLDDFLEKSGVDIVYISTPHPEHFEEIKACLENKIAVLCEKPIVLNHKQHAELVTLSHEKNTFLMEGMWLRFLPSFAKVTDLVKQKAIGEIVSINAGMCFRAPREKSNRFYDPEKGGGSLLDLGVYCIFLSTFLLGRPKEIKSTGRLSDLGIDEASGMLLSYKGGRYAMLESSLLKNHNGPAEIHGTKGLLRILDPWFEKSPAVEVEMYDGEKQSFPLEWKGHGLQFEIEEVVNCVSNNQIESTLMPAHLSNDILKIMDVVRKQLQVFYEDKEAVEQD